MSEEIEYVIIGLNSYGRDLWGCIDRAVRQFGGERFTEGGILGRIRVWKHNDHVLAHGLSIGSAEVARVRRNLVEKVQSIFEANHMIAGSELVTGQSQDEYPQLLAMHGKWILGLRVLFLVALSAVAFVTTLRLLIFSGMFQLLEPTLEFYSYAIGVLPLSFGLGTFWYMHMGNRAAQLIESGADLGERAALLVRFPQPQLLKLHTSEHTGHDSSESLLDRKPDFSIQKEIDFIRISEHIKLPKHSLYSIVLDTSRLDDVKDELRKQGGSILTAGRPHVVTRALFNLKLGYSILSGAIILLGTASIGMTGRQILGADTPGFWIVILSGFLVSLLVTKLVSDKMWIWLERRFIKASMAETIS